MSSGGSVQQTLAQAVRNPVLLQAAHAMNTDRPDIAERLLKPFLQDDPFNIAAIRMLAELANRIGKPRDAESLLRRALDLAPEFSAARANLATLLYRSGRSSEALAALEWLKVERPEYAGNTLHAAVLNKLGDFEQALAIYKADLARHANQPHVWMAYGHTLKTVGRLDEGVAAYRRAISLKPDFGEAWWSLANLKTLRFSDEDVEAMRAALAGTAITPEDQFHLEFALGKAFEDRMDAETAFNYYTRANAHRRALGPYDVSLLRAEAEALTTLFTPEFFAARAQGGNPDPAPIFIIGMPRAGSTLVEQILASHSAVEAIDELPDIPRLFNTLGRTADERLNALAALTSDERTALGSEYLAQAGVQRRTDKPYFIDKLPNNWLYIGFIRLILPNARFIDVRRHPLSCGFSNFRQHYARGQLFSYDLSDFGHYYAAYVHYMKHIDGVLPAAVHWIIYERLVADSAAEIRALLTALDLPYEEGCLAFHTTQRAVRTPSSEQVRQPIFTQGTENWQAYDQWLGPLKAALGNVLEHYEARIVA
ncbi:MAG: sulfotransferase [Alphaproteobacteria bacterium]|nr:sulfotransferase [Alphaproteobacteria bacterium]MDE2340176.1 sulfotransferase [Alphaproteobacteria bacterium]